MPFRTLRRAGLAVLFTVIALSALIFTVNQRVLAQPAAPNVLRPYPGPFPCNTSLQACIDGSSNGDVINIAANVYITSVTLNKAVSLIGAGAGSTIIQALPGQRVLTVTAAMNDATQIANLTIQGGNASAASGGGIFLSAGAQPFIQNVNVVANSAVNGGGVYASSAITLLNVTFNNNFATNGDGGGMLAGGNLIATNSAFQNNTVITNGSGGGLAAYANFTGTNVNFIGNTVNNGNDGGGLLVYGRLTLNGGQFVNNQVTRQKFYGGGGGLIAFGFTSISGTHFSGNITADWGGGAYIADFTPGAKSFMTNVQFISNTALSGGGGGLFMWFTSTLSAVDFFSNSAGYRGGGAYAGYAGNYGTLIMGGEYLSNTANGGGGLYSDSSFTLADTQFLSNTSRSNNGGGAWAAINANVSNAYFAYNTVITLGNSGGLDTGGHVAITSTTFLNNRTLNGSGGGSGAGGNATLNNVQYIGNSAKGDGGGVLAYGTASVTNGQFVSNTTGNLGGGLTTYSSAQVTGSRFENNRSAANWGGGFFADQPSWLTNTDFISNTSAYAGGAVGVQHGSLTVTGGRFERNLATTGGWGGAIYNGGPSLTISGTQFLSNTATATGGGSVGNTTFLTNTTYINNSAGTWGGGAEGFGPTQVFNGLFQNNRSQANGGGISSGSTVFVTNSRFINNTAQGDGAYGAGALAASLSVTTVNSVFIGNTANTSPGGAVAVGQNLYLYASDFSGNTAVAGDGGAVFAYGSATIDHTSFTTNQSNARGGAAFISSTVMISAAQFINNIANAGGGLYHAAGDGRIVNSLFARNTAVGGQGVALYASPTGTLQILFTTIGAPGLTNGDAVHITSGNVEIQNTIVTSHTTGLFRQGGTVFQDYNLLIGNTNPTLGIISGGMHTTIGGDPKFLNLAGDDYHIGLDSVAIDAGTDVGVYTDIDGQARPHDAGFDIGFDEMLIHPVYLPLVLR